MTLTLHILSSGAQPGRATAFPMVNGALTLGRSETNDVVLPDPTREISSSHAVVQERAGDYLIVDTSTNGTFLNGESEPLGDFPTPLNNGDTLRIGSYELRVEVVAAHAGADPFANLPPPLGEEPIVEDTAPTLDTIGEIGSFDNDGGDFLDGLLGQAPPNAMNMPTRQLSDDADGAIDDFLDIAPDPNLEGGASSPNHSAPGRDFFQDRAAGGAIPDSFDDDLIGGPLTPPAPSPVANSGGGGGLIPETSFTSEPFEIPPAPSEPQSEPAFDPVSPAPGIPEDDGIDALLGDGFADEPMGAADPIPEPNPEPVPPTAPPVRDPVVAPVSTSRGVAGGADMARQFLTAAGVDHSRIGDDELGDIMQRSGSAFRTLIEGAREVLMARASIRDELRLGQTTISRDGNNPIKFSISGEQAVEAMVKPTVAGYQDAEKAATEAMNDIKAHEVAMMSGMESAIKTLLGRFNPETLAAKIEDSGRLSGLLKGKKAQYWDVFEKLYGQLSEEAEEDFNALFGKAFAHAYQEQLQRLKSK